MVKSIPYASAQSGAAARDEVAKVLRRFGCESVGFMDDFDRHEVLLAFTHRGRRIQLRANAKGWAQMYLRENPWNPRRKVTKQEHERAALRQGQVAVNSHPARLDQGPSHRRRVRYSQLRSRVPALHAHG